MLDTDQLRSFLAIVDTGSFTRAAERVNKTQSAVSMHIRRLEERLGRALFAKQGRGVVLSPDGEKLVDHARRILQVEADALSDLKADGLRGQVRLGMPDDYTEHLLPEIVARFSARHPLVEISIVCEPSVVLGERVHAGDVDVAVVTDCERIRGLETLREEPLRWVAGIRAGPIEERRPLPLALSGPTCAWRRAALTGLEGLGIPAHLLLVSNSYAGIAPLVGAGLAVTVLPQSVVRDGLRVIPAEAGLPDLPPCRIGLLRGTSEHSREAAALCDDIRATLNPTLRPRNAVTEIAGSGQREREPLLVV
jgi:DNA-binding transcriptional LysR family regulator